MNFPRTDFAYRLEFVFLDEHKKFLTQKTWQLLRRPGEAETIYLLQARAVPISEEPQHEILAGDYSRLTMVVGGFLGQLECRCFDPADEAAIQKQLAAFPLSYYVRFSPERIQMLLYTK